jgi:hypothetical protein
MISCYVYVTINVSAVTKTPWSTLCDYGRSNGIESGCVPLLTAALLPPVI